MSRHEKGFTLIELMIVVVVIGVLASIAVPSYRQSVLSSHRADAKIKLMAAAQAQERWRVTHPRYASTSELSISGTDHYSLLVASYSATSFALAATPVGAQIEDACAVVTLNQAFIYTASGCATP